MIHCNILPTQQGPLDYIYKKNIYLNVPPFTLSVKLYLVFSNDLPKKKGIYNLPTNGVIAFKLIIYWIRPRILIFSQICFTSCDIPHRRRLNNWKVESNLHWAVNI